MIFRNIKSLFNFAFKARNGFLVILDYIGLLKIKRPYCLKLRNGLKFFVNSWESAGPINSIIFFKEYGSLKKSKAKEVYIDVGAHIGAFSVYSASLNKGRKVYAFEPESNNYKMLKKNISINSLHNIQPYNIAVAGKTGKGFLALGRAGTQSHSLFRKSKKTKEVKTISLNDIFRVNKINECDFLKMDCEGAEYDIFFNTNHNVLRRINKMFIECHDTEDNKCNDLLVFLKKSGIFNARKIEIAGYEHIAAEKKK